MKKKKKRKKEIGEKCRREKEKHKTNTDILILDE